jgi:signal transduction histidine kinase
MPHAQSIKLKNSGYLRNSPTTGGRVSITLKASDNEAVAQVRDTGIGISQEDLPFIFERFYRADKARSREGGAGLGLSIAKWIAEVHRASIHVDSVVGQGSTFEVRLPLHRGARVPFSTS